MTRKGLCLGAALMQLTLAGCGANIPQVNEFWEGRDVDRSGPMPVDNSMALAIKTDIFCELVQAIVDVNGRASDRKPKLIPDDFGVQLQTTITIDENTAVNPGVTLNRTFENAMPHGVTFGQSFNLGLGLGASRDAMRVDTAYTYWKIGKIANTHNLEGCKDDANRTGSSPLLRPDLGIEDYLYGAVRQADFLRSSDAGRAKTPKLDIYSYEVKFIVISNGNINPTWKLVNASSSNTMPFLSSGRTRTHDLILTFGPNAEKGLEPSYIAAAIHQNSGLRAVLDNRGASQ